MEKLTQWVKGERGRPLYAFEEGQNLKFGSMFFKPVIGSVAFFNGRYDCIVSKYRAIFIDANTPVTATFTVGPGELEGEILNILAPEKTPSGITDPLYEWRRGCMHRFGVQYSIGVETNQPAQASWGLFDTEEGGIGGIDGRERFNAESVLRSFAPYGFTKTKKPKEKRESSLLGDRVWAPVRL